MQRAARSLGTSFPEAVLRTPTYVVPTYWHPCSAYVPLDRQGVIWKPEVAFGARQLPSPPNCGLQLQIEGLLMREARRSSRAVTLRARTPMGDPGLGRVPTRLVFNPLLPLVVTSTQPCLSRPKQGREPFTFPTSTPERWREVTNYVLTQTSSCRGAQGACKRVAREGPQGVRL